VRCLLVLAVGCGDLLDAWQQHQLPVRVEPVAHPRGLRVRVLRHVAQPAVVVELASPHPAHAPSQRNSRTSLAWSTLCNARRHGFGSSRRPSEALGNRHTPSVAVIFPEAVVGYCLRISEREASLALALLEVPQQRVFLVDPRPCSADLVDLIHAVAFQVRFVEANLRFRNVEGINLVGVRLMLVGLGFRVQVCRGHQPGLRALDAFGVSFRQPMIQLDRFLT
jgi:hypothetical protein